MRDKRAAGALQNEKEVFPDIKNISARKIHFFSILQQLLFILQFTAT